MGTPGALAKRSAPGMMKKKHFAMAVCAWILLAAAHLRPIAAAEQQQDANSTTASRLSPPVPSSTSTSTKPKIKKAGAAIDLKTRPNDVYAPQNGSFDYFKLQVYWPPSIFKPQQQGQIWYLMKQQYAAKDFWTHGMWPSAAKGKDPAWCNGSEATSPEAAKAGKKRAWEPQAMEGLLFSLPFYLSFSINRANATAPMTFWRHQWEKHGSCSGMSQRDYFLAVYAASASLKLQQRLLPLGVTFSNVAGYNYTFLRKAVETAVGVPKALPARGAMECALAPGSSRVVLATVTVCVDKASLKPTPCGAGASGAEEEDGSSSGNSTSSSSSSTFSTSSPLISTLDDPETMAQLLSNAAARFDCSKAPQGTEIFLPALLNGIASSDQGWITAKGSAWFPFAAFAALVPFLAVAWWAARVAGKKHVRRPSGEIAVGGGGGVGGTGGTGAGGMKKASFVERWLLSARVVENPRVLDRVDVLEHALSLSRLEKGAGAGGKELARALRALPVGVGLTGEAARHVARRAFPDASSSTSSTFSDELPGPATARLVFFVPEGASAEAVEAAAGAAADVAAALCFEEDGDGDDEGEEGGSGAAAMGVVAARGATVLRCGGSGASSSSALAWFATRPLTFDELVVCRVSPPPNENGNEEEENSGLVLLSTAAALDDARARRARPAAHGPRGWELGGVDGTEVVPSRLAVACALAASLSGEAAAAPPHATQEIDASSSWAHWSRTRLSKAALFRLLLPFHADTASYLSALDAAASLGLVSRKDVRDCGGPNALWGVLIDEMNDLAARGGRRFVLDALDLDDVDAAVEADADRAEARAARRGVGGVSRCVRSRATAPARGPAWLEGGGGTRDAEASKGFFFFDAEAAAAAAAERVSQKLALKAKAAAAKAAAASDAAAAPKPPQQQQQPSQPLAAPLFSLPPPPPPPPSSSRPPPTPQQSAFRRRLSRISGRDLEEAPFFPPPPPPPSGAAAAAAGAPAGAAATDVDFDAASVAATAAVRSRAAARLAAASSVVGVVAFDRRRSEAGPRGQQQPAAAAPNARTAAAVATASSKNDNDDTKSKSMSKSTGTTTSTAKDAALASFYAPAEPEAGVLEADDAPERQRVPLLRLSQFLAGVAAASPGFLAAAYVALLCSVVSQLLVPLAFAMGFQALATGDGAGLRIAAAQAAGLAAAAVLFKLLGSLLLEGFARRALRSTYAGLFDHLLFQESSFLERLAPGELMVRASGGSQTLRSLVTTVAFSAVEGVLLFFGAVVFLLTSSKGLGGDTSGGGNAEQHGTLIAVAVAVLLAAAEAYVAGRFLWRQNLAVRRGLGAVLGFSTDVLSSPAAVLSLESGPARAAADARLFLRDYAAAARTQGVARATHTSLASAITAALRLALLWQGVWALFKGSAALSDVYALFATTNWMEAGLLLFADAYATAMADVGSLERLVELHDRGAVDPKKGGLSGGGSGRGGKGSSGGSISSSRRVVGPPTRFDLDGMMSGGSISRDIQRLTGGFALRGVKASLPGGNAQLLRGASAKVPSGKVLLVVVSDPLSGEGSALIDVLCLRIMPFKGVVEFEVEEAGKKEEEAKDKGDASAKNSSFVAFDWLSGDKRAVRRALGVVALNSAALFPTTLAENVSLASAASSSSEEEHQEAFREACEVAAVDELAAALPPRGFETVLSSSAGLPDGAALRVALARALLRRPALLLVDDADGVAAALGGAPRLGAALSKVLASGGTAVVVGGPSVARARSLGLDPALCEEVELSDGVLISRK